LTETLFQICTFSFDEWIGVLLEIGSLSFDRLLELCSVTFHLLKTWPLLLVGLIEGLFEVRSLSFSRLLEVGNLSFEEVIEDLLESVNGGLLELVIGDLLELVIGDSLEFGSL
jgi:hypothetical protein